MGTVTELRLHEDQAYASLAGVKLEDLALVDAPQRLSIDVAEISSARPLDLRDADVRTAISRHILSLSPDLVLAPLAIGDHIDHRIAQAAANDTGLPNLAFYEDLPYSSRASKQATENRARDLQLGLVPWQFSSADGKNWKQQCASLYPSQIDGNTVAEIAEFSERYNQGERFWVTVPAAELLEKVHRA